MCESCKLFSKFYNNYPLEDTELYSVKIRSQIKMIKMKKLTLCLMTAFMLLTIIPTQLKAEKEVTPVSSPATKPAESAEVNAILARLNEIKAMDKSMLSAAEKKDLRKELRQERVRIRAHSHGVVYIGGGTLILIIILIILLA
jgi:hypothetical protein